VRKGICDPQVLAGNTIVNVRSSPGEGHHRGPHLHVVKDHGQSTELHDRELSPGAGILVRGSNDD
jgi:hypothetical protein